MRRNGEAEERKREEFRSRQILAKADAAVKLVDDQLERLTRAAALYRQRLQGTKR